jgi:hypothetical protein
MKFDGGLKLKKETKIDGLMNDATGFFKTSRILLQA